MPWAFSSNAQQEEDTTNWAATTADPILLPEGTDATAQWTNVVSNGTLYGVVQRHLDEEHRLFPGVGGQA